MTSCVGEGRVVDREEFGSSRARPARAGVRWRGALTAASGRRLSWWREHAEGAGGAPINKGIRACVHRARAAVGGCC